MPSWLWIALTVAALVGIAVFLSSCKRGYDHPAVIATAAVASAFDHDGMSTAEEKALNDRFRVAVQRLRAICDSMAAAWPDEVALQARAAETMQLGLIVGHDILDASLKACVAFHAEAAGDFEAAYRLFFSAAVDSVYDREWAAEHGMPPKAMSDALHYRTLAAILRLRAAGHAQNIYHVGAEKVTRYTCERLRREAPEYAECR